MSKHLFVIEVDAPDRKEALHSLATTLDNARLCVRHHEARDGYPEQFTSSHEVMVLDAHGALTWAESGEDSGMVAVQCVEWNRLKKIDEAPLTGAMPSPRGADDAEVFELLKRVDAAAQLDVTVHQADEQLPADVHAMMVKYRYRAQQARGPHVMVHEKDEENLRSKIRGLIEQRAPLFDAHREAVTLGDAPPTEPGWYWERFEDKKPDVIHLVLNNDKLGAWSTDSYGDSEFTPLSDYAGIGWRWSGRIPEPT